MHYTFLVNKDEKNEEKMCGLHTDGGDDDDRVEKSSAKRPVADLNFRDLKREKKVSAKFTTESCCCFPFRFRPNPFPSSRSEGSFRSSALDGRSEVHYKLLVISQTSSAHLQLLNGYFRPIILLQKVQLHCLFPQPLRCVPSYVNYSFPNLDETTNSETWNRKINVVSSTHLDEANSHENNYKNSSSALNRWN
jgi:hypothetical protein